MLKQSEKDLQKMVCEYLKLAYPNVIFNSDMAGVKLSKAQAIESKNNRSHNGFPDLAIYEPRQRLKGLFIELKAQGTKIQKKDGSFMSEHLKEQNYILQQLSERGYYACFAIGFDEAKHVIDTYLNH